MHEMQPVLVQYMLGAGLAADYMMLRPDRLSPLSAEMVEDHHKGAWDRTMTSHWEL